MRVSLPALVNVYDYFPLPVGSVDNKLPDTCVGNIAEISVIQASHFVLCKFMTRLDTNCLSLDLKWQYLLCTLHWYRVYTSLVQRVHSTGIWDWEWECELCIKTSWS